MKPSAMKGGGWCSALLLALLLAHVGSTYATVYHGSPKQRPPMDNGLHNSKVLRFRDDGTFTITQFTDMHYGESDIKDAFTQQVQDIILSAENPDLVVMTGDSVSGYAWNNQQGWFSPLWKNLTEAMVAKNITWAFAFGNHDDQADLNRTEIVALDQTYEQSITQFGPSNIHGTTNYYLFVYSSNVTNEIPVAVLYIFDSSDTNCEGVTGWGCVYPDQISWYINTSSEITKTYDRIIPAIAFFHIPVPEFMYMWNNQSTYGRLQDTGVCCFSVNTGLFAAFKKMGDVFSVHCGHDHDNDFYGMYDGIMLAYGRKTGYGGYGPPSGWLRGARILQLQEEPFSLTHWIREQDGRKVSSIEQPLHPQPAQSPWTKCCGTTLSPASNCATYAAEFSSHVEH